MAEMILHKGTYYTPDDFAAAQEAEKVRERRVRAAAGGSSRVGALEEQVKQLTGIVDELRGQVAALSGAGGSASAGKSGSSADGAAVAADDKKSDDAPAAKPRARSSRSKKEES